MRMSWKRWRVFSRRIILRSIGIVWYVVFCDCWEHGVCIHRRARFLYYDTVIVSTLVSGGNGMVFARPYMIVRHLGEPQICERS